MPTSTSADLIEERGDLLDQMRALTDKAEAESRDLTHGESQKFDRLEKRVERLDAQLEEARARESRLREARAAQRLPALEGFLEAPDAARSVSSEPETPLLRRDQPFGDRRGFASHGAEAAAMPSLARMLRGYVTGDWGGIEAEHRALAEGTTTAGGFLTPELLSGQIIDRVRNRARVIEAGAQTLRLDSDSVSLPRLNGGAVAAWKVENAPVAESDPTFERVAFAPKTLAAAVRLSYELWDDMIDGGGALIENELVQALALEVDRAALRGSGTGQEPLGVRNQPGVTLQSLGANGANASWADIMAGITTLLGANYEPNALIWPSRTSQAFASFVDTTNQPLNPPAPAAGLQHLVSNQIPTSLTAGTSSTATEVYIGEWRNLVVGIRPSVRVDIQRVASTGAAPTGAGNPIPVNVRSSSEYAIGNMQVYVLAYVRADVQLLHPQAFVVKTGVLN